MMPCGEAANKLSGIVPIHIKAIQAVARELDVVLSFRQVNPNSAFWIQYGNAPTKGLHVKYKSEKGGALAGLLPSEGGRKESTVSMLESDVFGAHLVHLINEGKLRELTELDEGQDSHYKTILAQDDKGENYKFRLDQERQKFSVFKKNGNEFKPVKFKGEQGIPLTADYDPFDFYPKLKEHIAGFKHLDLKLQGGGAFLRHIIRENVMQKEKMRRESEGGRLYAAALRVVDDILELPDLRERKGKYGRLTKMDRFIIEKINDKISEMSRYPNETVQHGKEKRNTQYPELCDAVFFVLPNGQTLMSTTWEQTQAVDYALQQEDFISTVNRAYNMAAGTRKLFADQESLGANGEPLYKHGSGRTIHWDSRAAAEALYHQYMSRSECERSVYDGGSMIFDGERTSGPPSTAASTMSHQSDASFDSTASSIPEWLCAFARRESVAPSACSKDNSNPSSRVSSPIPSCPPSPSCRHSSTRPFSGGWNFSFHEGDASTSAPAPISQVRRRSVQQPRLGSIAES